MFRLRRTVKLLGIMTMSALLLWLQIMPVISQQAGPGPVRGQMLQHLGNALAQLTASGGNILDIDEAAFASLADLTVAYIPLAKDAPAWQSLFELVWKRKPVGPVPIGMLYTDGLLDAGDFKLKPGYYHLKVIDVGNFFQVIAEDEAGDITPIGNARFGEFRPTVPARTVESFVIGKQNPVWIVVVVGIGVLVGGCTVNFNFGDGCAGNNCQGGQNQGGQNQGGR